MVGPGLPVVVMWLVQSEEAMAALGRLGRCCRSLLHDSPKGLLCDLRRLGRTDRTIGRKTICACLLYTLYV